MAHAEPFVCGRWARRTSWLCCAPPMQTMRMPRPECRYAHDVSPALDPRRSLVPAFPARWQGRGADCRAATCRQTRAHRQTEPEGESLDIDRTTTHLTHAPSPTTHLTHAPSPRQVSQQRRTQSKASTTSTSESDSDDSDSDAGDLLVLHHSCYTQRTPRAPQTIASSPA